MVGRIAAKLTDVQSAVAWGFLTKELETLGDVALGHLPKFEHMLNAIRKATIMGKRMNDMLGKNSPWKEYTVTVTKNEDGTLKYSYVRIEHEQALKVSS